MILFSYNGLFEPHLWRIDDRIDSGSSLMKIPFDVASLYIGRQRSELSRSVRAYETDKALYKFVQLVISCTTSAMSLSVAYVANG